MKQQDRIEFEAYLKNCTDRQLAGVHEKESKANRYEYVRLTEAELSRRGLPIPRYR